MNGVWANLTSRLSPRYGRDLLPVKVFCQEVSVNLHGFPVRFKQTPGLIISRHDPFLPVIPWNSTISEPRLPYHSQGSPVPLRGAASLGPQEGHTMQPITPDLPSSLPGSLAVKPLLDLKLLPKVHMCKPDAVLWCFRMGKITPHLFLFPFQSLWQSCSVVRLCLWGCWLAEAAND